MSQISQNNVYNQQIRKRIHNDAFDNNYEPTPYVIPHRARYSMGGSVDMKSDDKKKLLVMLQRPNGAPAAVYHPEMDEKNPVVGYAAHPENFVRKKVRHVSKDNPVLDKNAPHYTTRELKYINRTGQSPLVRESELQGGALEGIGQYTGGAIPPTAAQAELEGGFNLKSIGNIFKTIGKVAKKTVPKVAKRVIKFAKGKMGQKLIGDVLSTGLTTATEVGVRNLLERPQEVQEPQEPQVVYVREGAGLLKDDLEKHIFDIFADGDKLKPKWVPVLKEVIKQYKKDKKIKKNETLEGGFIFTLIATIAGAITAAATAAGVGVEIANAASVSRKREELGKVRAGLQQARINADKINNQIESSSDPAEKEKLKNALKSTQMVYDQLTVAEQDLAGQVGAGRKPGKKRRGPSPKRMKPEKVSVKPDVVPEQAEGGKMKKKRTLSEKQKKRNDLLRKLMKERKLSLPEASRLIKQEKLM